MRALTLDPEYWLLLVGLMSAKLARYSSVTIGGPGERKKDWNTNEICWNHLIPIEFVCYRNTFRGKKVTCLG